MVRYELIDDIVPKAAWILLMLLFLLFFCYKSFKNYKDWKSLYLRIGNEPNQELRKLWRIRLFLSPGFLLYAIIAILCLVPIFMSFNFEPRFYAFEINDETLVLLHNNLFDKNINLLWSNISKVELSKKQKVIGWSIIITTNDGKIYKSSKSPTYKEQDTYVKGYDLINQKFNELKAKRGK